MHFAGGVAYHIQRMEVPPRIPHPTDVSDEEWAFVFGSQKWTHLSGNGTEI
jgi:hypothetical protein